MCAENATALPSQARLTVLGTPVNAESTIRPYAVLIGLKNQSHAALGCL
jgi:hypothetical protein